MKPISKMSTREIDISQELEHANESSLFTNLNNIPYNNDNNNQNIRAPSEPILSSNYNTTNNTEQISNQQTSVITFDNLFGIDKNNDNFGIGAMDTIDIHLCVEDNNKNKQTNDEDCTNNSTDSLSSSIQRHNKYMFTNKFTKQFYFAPYKKDESNWHIFEFNNIFASETSFLCDIFSNVIQPLIESFKNGQSGCLALYSPDKTEWNDRLQLFDIVHQILLQLNIDKFDCKISAYEINDDNVYDL
eukprot:213854_1